MNKIRKEQIVDTTNQAIETINKGYNTSISRRASFELTQIIAELLQEIDDKEDTVMMSIPKQAITRQLEDICAFDKTRGCKETCVAYGSVDKYPEGCGSLDDGEPYPWCNRGQFWIEKKITEK